MLILMIIITIISFGVPAEVRWVFRHVAFEDVGFDHNS